tara:strand:- start:1126 stop:1443 length:318 start_codon:yes stop_codon:yes gene_type:complete
MTAKKKRPTSLDVWTDTLLSLVNEKANSAEQDISPIQALKITIEAGELIEARVKGAVLPTIDVSLPVAVRIPDNIRSLAENTRLGVGQNKDASGVVTGVPEMKPS